MLGDEWELPWMLWDRWKLSWMLGDQWELSWMLGDQWESGINGNHLGNLESNQLLGNCFGTWEFEIN